MDIRALLNAIQTIPGCTIYPPLGLPRVQSHHVLPQDLSEFYSLCGGVSLFADRGLPVEIVSPEYVMLANPIQYLGLCLPREQLDAMRGDLSWSWYVIADLCDHNFISIDLDPQRLGRCYDSSWALHPHNSDIIATSFTDLLNHLVNAQGDSESRYWEEPDFERLGNPYE
jgi:antitoxin YokJ